MGDCKIKHKDGGYVGDPEPEVQPIGVSEAAKVVKVKVKKIKAKKKTSKSNYGWRS